MDLKKAARYYALAAMGGDLTARYNLGMMEETYKGNFNRALRHYVIAAGGGCDDSLDQIRHYLALGRATKDNFEGALRAHKIAKDEVKSDRRDLAAAEW